jgi:hypothetical protein
MTELDQITMLTNKLDNLLKMSDEQIDAKLKDSEDDDIFEILSYIDFGKE